MKAETDTSTHIATHKDKCKITNFESLALSTNCNLISN